MAEETPSFARESNRGGGWTVRGEGPPDRDAVASWAEKLAQGGAPEAQTEREWRAIFREVVSALLAAESWPGRTGSPKLLLDEIAHRTLEPGADVRRRALAAALAEACENVKSLNDRIFLLRELALVGGKEEVLFLGRWLESEQALIRSYALRALEANPSEEAANALRRALPRAKSPRERGALLSALGARRDPASLDDLAPHVGAEEREVARAAIQAVARTGSPRAPEVLGKAWEAAPRQPARKSPAPASPRHREGFPPRSRKGRRRTFPWWPFSGPAAARPAGTCCRS